MRLITLSTDRRLFDEGSDVARRMREQSAVLSSHLIIVAALRSHGRTSRTLNEKVRIVPTSSHSRLLYGFDAIHIARRMGGDADLITAQDPFETGLAAVLLGRLCRVPVQIQIHADLFSPHFRPGSLLNRLRVLLARIVIPRASCIRVVSERMRRSLVERFGDKLSITVLPVFSRPLDENPARAALPYARSILAVSRLEPEKGVAAALDAFARIASAFPDVGLVIAGEGRSRTGLEERARRLGVAARVTFLGWRTDVPALMRAAALYLHTSPAEGYGLALLEAARAKLPIVSTDVGIVGELIPRELITVVPALDARGIADGLCHALTSNDAAVNADRLAQRLPPSPSLDEYLRLLSECYAQCVKVRAVRHHF